MAPLKTHAEQNDTVSQKSNSVEVTDSAMDLHPEAYKVKGPMPEKMKTVSASLRHYAEGIYGLL